MVNSSIIVFSLSYYPGVATRLPAPADIMNRYVILIIIAGILYALFSTCDVTILTWKDSDNLERIVITPKNAVQKSEIPPLPDGVAEGEQRLFEKGEGPMGVGSYAVKSMLKLIPKESAPGKPEEQASVQPGFVRKYSVGKLSEDEMPAPSLSDDSVGNTLPTPDASHIAPPVGNISASISAQKYLASDKDENDYANPKVPRKKSFDDQILIASFNVDPWWEEDSRNSPELAAELASILVQFDMVAVQGFRIDNTRFLDDLVRHLSDISAGKGFRYVAATLGGLRVSANDPALIFIYDTTTMEVDPYSVSYLGKPNDPFKYRPLAATFRTRKTSVDKAFTFTAVNVFLATQREQIEFSYLPQLVETAKKIKPNPASPTEDDVIIMGHFGIDPPDILPDGFPKTFTWSVFGLDTNAWGTFHSTTENIGYFKHATVEANGGGVWSLKNFFQRKNGIPFDYHPVWLLLSIYEGGKN